MTLEETLNQVSDEISKIRETYLDSFSGLRVILNDDLQPNEVVIAVGTDLFKEIKLRSIMTNKPKIIKQENDEP